MATSPESFLQHDSISSAESISNCANSNSAEVVNTDESAHTPADSGAVPPLADTDSSDFNATQSEKRSIEAQEQHFSLDEIPEPIKVLDDIISEFEDTSKPPSTAGANGENQSEDDGYMSLSRKNMHKKDFENVSQSSIGSGVLPAAIPNKEFREFESGFAHSNEHTESKEPANKSNADSATEQHLIQSTLPKARPASAITTNYSSLPCCGVRSTSVDSKVRGLSCNGERNALGIDISAVHNAVLRGGLAKLPEPILNEHPVTIYPGRYSPPSEGKRSNRPQRLLSSVEKHKEVCHILNPLSSISSSSSSTSTSSNSAGLTDSKHADITLMNNIAKTKPYIRRDNENKFRLVSEDDFSDDSIEEASLSPPITTHSSPHKPASIAWEIHFKSNKKKSKATSKKKPARKQQHDGVVKVENGFPSVARNDVYVNAGIGRALHTESRGYDEYDGPDKCSPPSADILNYCMYRHTNMLGKGTFVIRRAAKKPPKAIDIFKNDVQQLSAEDEGAKSLLSREEKLTLENNEIYKADEALSINSRHSLERTGAAQGVLLTSPRDRLSLNLEPQLPNAYSKVDRTPTEEFTASMKKGSVKRDIKKQSSESINTKSSSFEEIDEEQTDEAADLNGNASNVFPYKSSNANGLKSQEFNELRSSNTTTPHTDLAPTLEEEEEQYSDFSYGCAAPPLKQIENNISALLRGEIAVVRVGDGAPQKRPLEFRPGVHKSESAKEMLLSQNAFGPLPPSPPSSNPDSFDYDAMPPLPPLPPLPPSPKESTLDDSRSHGKSYLKTTAAEIHTPSLGEERRNRENMSALRYLSNELPPLPPPAFENLPPAVPPHRGHSANTMKSWSIDSNYKKKSPKMLSYGSGITTPTGSQYEGSYSTKRYVSYGTKRGSKQSPREELRLQTSCSLPETPIFARGCDIPRTPFRRQNESAISGSRTAPRSSTSHSINMGTSIVGISGGNTFGAGMCRQRSMNHALASNEMLRLSGAPARGWYPKQRSMRPASTENIDRLSSVRVWDSAAGMSGTGHSRKPLTLPPNLTPSFLNKSPREALRRVTSLLIAKKKNTKERKPKPYVDSTLDGNHTYEMDTADSLAKDVHRNLNNTTQKPQKKKGLFKNLWKRTKHVSLDQ